MIELIATIVAYSAVLAVALAASNKVFGGCFEDKPVRRAKSSVHVDGGCL